MGSSQQREGGLDSVLLEIKDEDGECFVTLFSYLPIDVFSLPWIENIVA